MIRLFVTDDLEGGMALAPSPEQARYLTAVMRRTVGDELRLFNGRDGEWRARIAEVTRRGCQLDVETCERAQAFGPDLELVVAIVKRSRLETIVEKAAELGARRVRLVTTRRTNADRANVGRLTAIAVEASEQTGRLDVPEIVEAESLERVLDGWDVGRRLVFCDEGGGAAPMQSVLSSRTARSADPGPPAAGAAPAQNSAPGGPGSPLRSGRDDNGGSILIGPEGGFAPEEQGRLRSLSFVTAVSLGPRVLRADTAAIAAMTLWQAAEGDWAAGLPTPS